MPEQERTVYSFPSPCCGAKALTSLPSDPALAVDELVRFFCPFCRVHATGYLIGYPAADRPELGWEFDPAPAP